MSDQRAIEALISDLHRQVDELRSRGVKDNAGRPYNPAHYKRGLEAAIDRGGDAVVDYVRRYVHRPPSDGFKKLRDADALDLACEWLVADEEKVYAHVFGDEDREAAQARLAPHIEAIRARDAARRARINAARVRLRSKGVPQRADLDYTLRSRKNS